MRAAVSQWRDEYLVDAFMVEDTWFNYRRWRQVLDMVGMISQQGIGE